MPKTEADGQATAMDASTFNNKVIFQHWMVVTAIY
jgi:hypothetical protein